MVSSFWREKLLFKNIKTYNLNLGPQHPAAHGVLRLLISLNGEIVDKIDPQIGLLHRGTEKLIEDKIYLHSIPYFDRFDYVSMLTQEHAFCNAIESLTGMTNYTATFVQIRTLYDEITRILNHLLAISCHALDVGSMSPIFWAFEEREKLMEFYERISGARMHAAFYRPGEINTTSISTFLLEDILEFSKNFFTPLSEINNLLTTNKIWKQRLINVGTYSYREVLQYGLSGVMSRCTGLRRDLRLNKIETYGNYYYLNFRGYTGQRGDSYDRFLIRMSEMIESVNIILQVINSLKRKKIKKKIKKTNPNFLIKYLTKDKFNKNNYKNEYISMEKLIKHFKYWTDGFPVETNYTYRAVESPKGEFGVSLFSNGTNKPQRCKIRTPAFHSLQFLKFLGKGITLADLVTLLGTIDIVFGEIDR